MMKIGILGGTFDPPHLGHLAIGEAALDQLGLDEILVIPTGRNPLKKRGGQSAPRVRLAMAQDAFASEPGFAVTDIEISRPGPSYAVDTLEELQMVRPSEYWFIVGSDILPEVTRWHRPEELVKLCRIAVAERPSANAFKQTPSLPDWIAPRIDPFTIAHPVDISSTKLREMIASAVNPERWLNPRVLDYIRQRGLYKD